MRAQKNTAIQFGLVNIPVGICKATEDRKVKLNLLSPDLEPVIQQYATLDGEWIGTQAECKRGAQKATGEWVEVDLSVIDPELPECLEVLDTIPLKDIDVTRITGHKQYLQSPKKMGNPKGYALLVAALKKAKRAAVTEYAARSCTQPALILEEDGALVLITLNYAADMRQPDIDVLAPSQLKVSSAEVEMANKLLDAITTGGVLDVMENKALPKQEEVLEAALTGKARKAKGKKTVAKDESGDLMAQLAASLAA